METLRAAEGALGLAPARGDVKEAVGGMGAGGFDKAPLRVRHSLWLACPAVCFVIGIQFSIVQANSQSPPHLSMPMILSVVSHCSLRKSRMLVQHGPNDQSECFLA